MLTYNSVSLSRDTWEVFEAFVKDLKKKLGARGWSACLELSLHADATDVARFHLHDYLLWTDGIGVHCRDLDVFICQGVRPRIDVCTTKSNTLSFSSAASHGLWYVSLKKRWDSVFCY